MSHSIILNRSKAIAYDLIYTNFDALSRPSIGSYSPNACHKIDKYLEENYATQLPWHQLENLVFSLLGELQYYSTNKREVARDEFENKLLCWVKFYVNFVDYELQDSKKFRRLYGFDASPSLRIAVNKSLQSRKIKNCTEVNKNGKKSITVVASRIKI